MTQVEQQVDEILEGRSRAISRALSIVENEDFDGAHALMGRLYPRAGKALVIGVTGSPGAGKSTLVDQLARAYRAAGKKVGIIAVDPTSPFSGGAILGDRIRMQAVATDRGVFIRSMATRGRLGGLAAGVNDGVVILDAAGYEVVLVETVGVGQDEVDIVKTAEITLVVLVPGMGDDIQTIKAGIMEIADLFVINKADRDGVGRLRRELEGWLGLGPEKSTPPPVLETVASTGRGVERLQSEIERIRTALEERGESRKKRRSTQQERILEIFRERVQGRAIEAIPRLDLETLADRVARHELDPYSAAEQILRRWIDVEQERESKGS